MTKKQKEELLLNELRLLKIEIGAKKGKENIARLEARARQIITEMSNLNGD